MRTESGEALRRSVGLPTWLAAVVTTILLLAPSPARSQEIVDPRSGRLLLTVTDLVVPAGPVILEVERSLDPRSREQRLLGTHWRLNWESRLFHYGELVVIEDGPAVVTFERDAGKPEYTSRFGDRVVFEADGRAVLTRLDETRDTFDAQGRLVERDLRNGNRVGLRYGADGRLTRVEGPRGSFVQFTADGDGHLVRVESSSGKTVRYGYMSGEVSEVQVGVAPPVRYAYDADGRLARIEDPVTGPMEIAYDPKGRVARRRWADGSQERYEHDEATRTVRHIDPAGAIASHRWSADGRKAEATDALGRTTTLAYDEAGRLLSVTGRTGKTSRMTYDRLGRLMTAEDQLGQSTRFEYIGATSRPSAIVRPDGSRQTFDYDGQGNVVAIKVEGKPVASMTYHPDGSVASVDETGVGRQQLTYHRDGRLASVTNGLGETTRFEYDARGNLVRSVNALKGATVATYDAQDRLVSVTDPAAATVRYEYDARGVLRKLVDAAGGTTVYDYDALGRVVAETDPAGQTTRYEYDQRGLLARSVLPDGRQETSTRDAAGNVTAIKDLIGRTEQFEYGPDDLVRRERDPAGLERTFTHDAVGRLVGWRDALGGGGALEYDRLGRPMALATATGATTRYTYDALDRLTAITDPLGSATRLTYDVAGRLGDVLEGDGSRARYEYDAAGRLSLVRRPGGGEDRFSYDQLGNVSSSTNPLGNRARWGHDAAGRLLRTTDAKGQTIEFAYDAAGRLAEKRLPDGRRATYRYDVRGNLVRVDDGAFPVGYGYDAAGRLTRIEYPALKRALTYEYNAAGLLARFIDSEKRTTSYEYDAAGRLNLVRLPDGQAIAFVHDAKGRRTSVRYPNGVIGNAEYDANSRLTRLAYTGPGGRTIAELRYAYDAAGKVVETTDHEGRTTRYRYDPAGQLLEEANGAGRPTRYRYLPGGNRAEREAGGQTTRYRYDVADRLLEAGGETFAYDANGNLVERRGPAGTTRYSYDAEDRLVKVVRPDGAEVTFGYAPTGERIWRRDAKGKTYFVTDGTNVLAELDEQLNARASYLHESAIDTPLVMTRDGQTAYYHLDRLGSVRAVTDPQGQVLTSYDYDAFGRLRSPPASLANPFTYTAREWDPSIGLYYYRARYYDADLGRFLSLDSAAPSLAEPLELNPYLYASNNPVRFVDPLGLANWTPEEKLAVAMSSRDNAIRNLKWARGLPDGGGGFIKDYQRQLANSRAEINELRAQHPGLKPRLPESWGGPPAPAEPPSRTAQRGDVPAGRGNAGSKTAQVQVGGGSAVNNTGRVETPAAPKNPTQKIAVPAGNAAGGGGSGIRGGVKAGGGIGVNLLPPRPDVEGFVGKGPGNIGGRVLGGTGIATAIANFNACRDEGRSRADCLNEIKDALTDPKNIAIIAGVAGTSLIPVIGPPLAAGLGTGLAGAGMAGTAERSGNVPAVQATAARKDWYEQNKARFDGLLGGLKGEIEGQLKPPRDAALGAREETRQHSREARAAADQAGALMAQLRALRDAVQSVAGECGIRAAMLQGQVVAGAAEAKQADQDLTTKVAEANAKAAACASKEAADELGQLQQQIESLAAKGRAAAARMSDQRVQLGGILERAEVARQSLGAAEQNAAEIARLAGVARTAADAADGAATRAEEKAAEFQAKQPALLARVRSLQGTFDVPEALGRLEALVGTNPTLAGLPGDDTRSVVWPAQEAATRASGLDGEAKTILAAMKALPLCQGITSPDEAVKDAPATGAFANAGADLPGKVQVCLAKLPSPSDQEPPVTYNPTDPASEPRRPPPSGASGSGGSDTNVARAGEQPFDPVPGKPGSPEGKPGTEQSAAGGKQGEAYTKPTEPKPGTTPGVSGPPPVGWIPGVNCGTPITPPCPAPGVPGAQIPCGTPGALPCPPGYGTPSGPGQPRTSDTVTGKLCWNGQTRRWERCPEPGQRSTGSTAQPPPGGAKAPAGPPTSATPGPTLNAQQCATSVCETVCRKNCETLERSRGQDCSVLCATARKCTAGESGWDLRQVKAECYQNIVSRCTGGCMGNKRDAATCHLRAVNSCGCDQAVTGRCAGSWDSPAPKKKSWNGGPREYVAAESPAPASLASACSDRVWRLRPLDVLARHVGDVVRLLISPAKSYDLARQPARELRKKPRHPAQLSPPRQPPGPYAHPDVASNSLRNGSRRFDN